MKLTQKERQFAQMIGTIPVFLFLIIVGALWKVKKVLWQSVVVFFIVSTALQTLNPVAYAPRAQAALNGYEYVAGSSAQLTEHQQIINYIHEVFGKDADDAFKVLSCENHALNPDAQNWNSNGSEDIGIMQINSIHGVPAKYLFDWHTNISIGYQIFKDSGWNAWTCVSLYHVLK